MNTVSMYLAGAWTGSTAKEEEVRLGVKNKLCSFLYLDQFRSWMEVSKGQPGKIIIDSGAFSAWNKGKFVDFDKYIQYCKGCIKEAELDGKTIRVVNLDVIPGKKGETASLNRSVKKEDKDTIDQAAKSGYENMLYFIKNGVKPIHVFHQGESLGWLEKMVAHTDYIGISPANDVAQKDKRLWIDKVFSFMVKSGINVKTHGFAVFSPSVILDYPWTSCDAATWRLVAGYGGIYYPVGGFKNPDYSRNPFILHVSEKAAPKHSFLSFSFLKDWKDLLRSDGYNVEELQDWGARCAVNIRYFLALERWINKEKRKKEFIPRNLFGLEAK
jgi:hypothetical protein